LRPTLSTTLVIELISLRRAVFENIEGRLPHPPRDEAVRMLPEFRTAEVESDDLNAIQNSGEILPPHRRLPAEVSKSYGPNRCSGRGASTPTIAS
jgi:hypothetical protein